MSEEQRSQPGCIVRRMQRVFHHGLLGVFYRLWVGQSLSGQSVTGSTSMVPTVAC